MHRITTIGVVLFSVVSACDLQPRSGGPLATDPDAGRPAICDQLEREIGQAVAVRGSCNTAADCDMIGGQLAPQTCNCAPFVLDCGGFPIESNAPGLATAKAKIAQYAADRCLVGSGACDCGPRGELFCTVDHRCTAEMQSCGP